jgi:hypothetical protein
MAIASGCEVQYDGFGRRASIKETVGGVTQELSRTAYSPLAIPGQALARGWHTLLIAS